MATTAQGALASCSGSSRRLLSSQALPSRPAGGRWRQQRQGGGGAQQQQHAAAAAPLVVSSPLSPSPSLACVRPHRATRRRRAPSRPPSLLPTQAAAYKRDRRVTEFDGFDIAPGGGARGGGYGSTRDTAWLMSTIGGGAKRRPSMNSVT